MRDYVRTKGVNMCAFLLWVFTARVGDGFVETHPSPNMRERGALVGFFLGGGVCLAECICATPTAQRWTLAFVFPSWGIENIQEWFPGKGD